MTPHIGRILGAIPTKGGPQADKKATLERERLQVGVSYSGVSNGRGRITGGEDPHLPPPEHSCTVNYDRDHYGPVSGGGEASRIIGGKAVVGSEKLGLGRYADGRSGGGTGIWGGGYGEDSDRDIQKLGVRIL